MVVVDDIRKAALLSALGGLGEVPSFSAIVSRFKRETKTHREVIILARGGPDALKRAYPAQRRDRSHFHAMEALNADGHRIDVRVAWPDWWPEGRAIARPMLLVVQDLYSGRILACRVAQGESSDLIRLAFADTFIKYGLPDKLYLDNGRGFASKWLSGGMRTRYRFRVRPEDPMGIFTLLLGPKAIHWTKPYSGQSKPIERAFKDFCNYISRHAAFDGAYTGSSTTTKPENAGTRAVPLAVFLKVLREEVFAHNARIGRRSLVCRGRSFDEVFGPSHAEAVQRGLIRYPSEHELRMLLLAADGVTVGGDGTVQLSGERYYCEEAASELAGQRCVVRFDPTNPATPVTIYRMDGSLVGEAQPLGLTRFDDQEAAALHGKKRGEWIRKHRVMLDATREFSPAELAARAAAPVIAAEKADAIERKRSAARIEQREGSQAFANLERGLASYERKDREAM